MNNQSELYTLLHHLKGCPSEFLDLHVSKSVATPAIDALILDLYRQVFGDFAATDDKFPDIKAWLVNTNENRMISLQIGCWFFSHERFKNKPVLLTGINHFLLHALPELCAYVNYKQWIEDDDRAEEFVRLSLNACNILLDKETSAEAADRFDSLSTIKRQKVLAESNAAIQRMKEIRQRMEEQKAREAANVYGKE